MKWSILNFYIYAQNHKPSFNYSPTPKWIVLIVDINSPINVLHFYSLGGAFTVEVLLLGV